MKKITLLLFSLISTITFSQRSVEFSNVSTFIPVGESLPAIEEGDVVAMQISYETDGPTEGINNIQVQVRQFNGGSIVATSTPVTAIGPTSNSTGTNLAYNFAMPTTFSNGSTIPFTSNLPAGNSLAIQILMNVANPGVPLITSTNEINYEEVITLSLDYAYDNEKSTVVLDKAIKYSVYSLDGLLVAEGNSSSIELDFLNSGVYVVVTEEGAIKVVKH